MAMLIWKASAGLWSEAAQMRSDGLLRGVTCHLPQAACDRAREQSCRAAGQARGRLGGGSTRTPASGSRRRSHSSLQSGKEASSAATAQVFILLNENKVQKRKYSPNVKGINHLNIMTIHIIYLKLLIIVISAFNTNVSMIYSVLEAVHALEKEMATHSSVLAWRTPGTGEPVGLASMGPHRVGHD